MRSETAINPHERFEELAALALIGELTAQEHQELQAHLESCEPCLQEYAAYDGILSRQLPLLHQEHSFEPLTRQLDVAEGFSTSEPADSPAPVSESLPQPGRNISLINILLGLPKLPRIAYGTCAILAIALAIVFVDMQERGREAQAQITALKDRISALSREVQNRPTLPLNDAAKQIEELRPQQDAQSARLAQRVNELKQQLSASADEMSKLKDQLQSSQDSDKALAQRINETQQQLERASADLQAVSQDREQTSVNLKNKETELLALEQELTTLRESVDRDRALLAASYDITNLMGARNLRIIDVSDVDGKGKTRKAFGRVFFTEGKSLVFYAFDLPDVKSSARPASFQAWGAQGANLPAAKSLGIFFRDDHNSNRWVLKFNDPQVLSEIDSVFVTVEPLGGSKKPTGTPLLPAYLKAELNHP